MLLSERLALEAASDRVRAITNACSLAGRPELVPGFVASDRSLSDVLRALLRLRALDQVAPGAVLPN